MAEYADELRLIDARALYFRVLGKADGGYNDRWVKLKMGPIPLAIPNTKTRRKAVPLHDAHHVLTGFDPNWVGEFEISAWEIASGCGRYSFAWIINLQGFFAGLLYSPRPTFRAFLRGRRESNLYHYPYSDETLQRPLGELRRQLRITGVTPVPTARDYAAFTLWSTIAVGASLASLVVFPGLPLAALAYGLIRLT